MNEAIHWMEENLKIQPKMGGLMSLKLNAPQRRIITKAEERRLAGLPARLVILKTRVVGVTTAVQGYFAYLQRNGYMHSLTLTLGSDAKKSLVGLRCCMLDNMPDAPTLERRYEERGQLVFSNGGAVNFEVAHGNPGMARTCDLVHVSEAAFMDGKNILSVKQCLPERGICFLESTGDGANHFLGEWLRATYGMSEYTPIFIPWFENEWCVMPLDFSEVLDYDDEELMLRKLFNLRDDQLKWRRQAIANHCNGDVNVFHREYPSFPEEAFGLRVGDFTSAGVTERVVSAIRSVEDEINRHRYIDITVKVQDGRVVMTEIASKHKPA